MHGIVKAEQFDPGCVERGEKYPEHAWCHGDGAFYCSTKRGHAHISKTDWILTFDNGEVIPVSNDTYERYFKEPDPGVPAAQEAVEPEAEAASESGEPRSSGKVDREDPQPRKSRHSAQRA